MRVTYLTSVYGHKSYPQEFGTFMDISLNISWIMNRSSVGGQSTPSGGVPFCEPERKKNKKCTGGICSRAQSQKTHDICAGTIHGA